MSAVLSEEWLNLENALGGARPCLKGTPSELQQQFDGLIELLSKDAPPPDNSVSTKDGSVDGIKYRIYTPVEAASKGPLPVGVFTHGGGFVVGNLDSEDVLCRVVAQHTPCIIVSVDYRLGPEHKLPVMVEDTITVYNWAWKNASSYGGDPTKFFSIGGSAGGGLALSVANHFAKDGGHESNRGVVAIVPLTLHWDNVPEAYRDMYKSYTENGENVPVIDKDSMIAFYGAVDADPKDSNVFTGISPYHKHFPPTYIVTCGADPLRDDGNIMEHALRNAGVKTKIDTFPKLPHYFWIFSSLESSKMFIEKLLGGVKWVLSNME